MFTAGERFAEAKQAYREAIALGDEGASWQLADAVLQSEGLEAAEPWFRRAMDAGELRAARDLARAFFRADRVDEAEELYKLAINAGVPWARLGLADVLSHFVGREEEAEAMYLKAIDENDAPVPLVDLAHVNYGVFLVDEGRIEEAQQQLQEAIRAGADPETLGYLERALADP
jgi:pentatricopeptide repeat protein